MGGKRILRSALGALLCAAVLLAAAPPVQAAEGKTLLLGQAQNMAVSQSGEISRKYSEILLKKMKYVEAVEGIKAKVKNKKSFRWSPLLSFKFPEPLNMVEEYELNVKPLTLQGEIDTLQHEMDDLRYAALNEVNKLFTQVYVSQEKIAFQQEVLDSAQEELERNRSRLLTGKATQTDVDTMTKRVETLTTELSNLKRAFETEKKDLSDLIGLDVTSGYTFRSPLTELDLPREMLDSIIEYTVENDHSVYQARMTTSTALMNLESYESLMRSQYGGKMDGIQGFVDMAKQGQKIDEAAFQIKYKEFLTAIDEPWSGKIRILFFTFTMEWFKGEISGSRYIEDEMYALYTACTAYANAKSEQEATEEEVRKQVSASYEALVNAWKAYESLAAAVEEQREALDKAVQLNKLGRTSYEAVSDAQKNYQEGQTDALDALASYDELLFEFDRLTCGAVTRYMKGESLDMGAGSGGDSIAAVDVINDPYYYIYTSVSNLTFHIGVSIPESFGSSITSFEVWSDGQQIGTRTPVGREVTHLTLDYGGSSTLLLRFYDGDKYVSECEIDATISRNVLPLEQDVYVELPEKVIGTYKVTTTEVGGISLSELSLSLNTSVGAAAYSITYGTQQVYTTEARDLSETFSYLTLLIASLDEVTLNLYGRDGQLMEAARFDTQAGTIVGEGGAG